MKMVCAVLLFLALTPLAIAQPADANDSVRDQLARIDASLKEIARSLKQQADTQQADLLLKRVSLALTQLAAGEERLKRFEDEMRTVGDQDAELRSSMKMLEGKAPASETAAATQREQVAEINRLLARSEERLAALNQQRIETQNAIEAHRRDAREWQASLDKFLSSRP